MSPTRGTDSTRERIVAAATAEFARHGIAGARIDRIAKNAKTSKERVYAHFASKEDLYRVISAQELAAIAEATRMDPADLPGYAGRVHDYFRAHPERHRIMQWGQLELGSAGSPPDEAIRQTVAHKVEQVRQAQEAGLINAGWAPLDVLVLVNQIATSWVGQPGFDAEQDPGVAAARRATVVAAVERLFPAAGGAPEA
ncbi:AcrR family transcriptional regulator [Kibdelosporangium banguiense]|uniref:AcrR family transcriptional regulator n=1 Tax=Kibdelosporangium banguiense TaxID=1365924 RepID=A0ABS4U188_9PSEU|nr:TetR family transcriptional regulator [Kibdelosporangium banguiense]MBP2330424.1 AcrR family transcriptional regulator [Kibdelosporangium banguiense]